MKSIKPGRGPSMMSGIMSVAMALFGILWTIVAASSGGGLFALFGVIFVLVAIVQAVYNFKNATGENRYSAFDITSGAEEPDPLNARFGNVQEKSLNEDASFCPYCGNRLQDDFSYCNKCGRKQPD